MDRRHFIKTIFSTTLFSPLILKAEPRESKAELYLISSRPESYLPTILEEIKKKNIFSSQSLSFPSFHPREKEISHALLRQGWPSPPSPRADLLFSYRLLNEKKTSSFTFVQGGQVRDIRSAKLYSLWQQMSVSDSLSSELTVITIKGKPFMSNPGQWARVWIEGRPVDSFALDKSIHRSYKVSQGRLVLQVKNHQVKIVESCCQKEICLHTPPVKISGERIICAPNRFLVELKGNSVVDAVIG